MGLNIKHCRVCNNTFFAEPLLKFENMPKGAQYLPDNKSLQADQGVSLEICQCSGCGLVQTSNEPVPYYKDVIRAAAFSEEMKKFREGQFSAFVKKYNLQGRKVIEIGCGRGEYLSIMKKNGVAAYGLENLAESVDYCVNNGLNVSSGYLDRHDDKIKGAPFDAFFILNFLEHFPDPNAFLKGTYNNLSDHGLGLVEVPNFDMILEKKLFSEFISDHLLYFTKETLRFALNMNGFEVLECATVWHEYIISAVVKKRPEIDLTDFYAYQEKLKKEINQYLEQFRSVAIWGAGHQALAVIALADLSGKITYVVDSAPFKQGKFTPATHIPIVSPERLNSDPVDAIIIMAASYSDEVARIIREKYQGKIKTAILRDYGLELVHN